MSLEELYFQLLIQRDTYLAKGEISDELMLLDDLIDEVENRLENATQQTKKR